MVSECGWSRRGTLPAGATARLPCPPSAHADTKGRARTVPVVAPGGHSVERIAAGARRRVGPGSGQGSGSVRGRRADHYRVAIPTAALLSFRLGGSDGVSVESAKWAWALDVLGFEVLTVAGSGPVDRRLPGLAIGAPEPPTRDEVLDAINDADLVVVENLCSLPLNPAAGAVVASALAGRPAVLHHHDLPWQRAELSGFPPPPDDRRWRHVTINELSRRDLLRHGIEATTLYNRFDPAPFGGSVDRLAEARRAVRAAWDLDETARLVLQPTRAIPRKNVAGGIRVASGLGAVFWLLGNAEDGFGPELERLVARADVPVLRGWPDGLAPPHDVASAYAACDVVALPSTWEGFGNPAIESAVHRRPLAIGPYPVGRELASFGFDWFALGETPRLDRWLTAPTDPLLDRNARVAAEQFALDGLPGALAAALPPW